MKEYETSDDNYLVDSKGLFSGRLEQKIIEKFGSVGIPDYNGKYKKSLQQNKLINNPFPQSQEKSD